MSIGKNIQTIRKKRGLSQQELGKRLGVSGSMIGQYENDLRNPKIETLQKIANVLECDEYWLINGKEISLSDQAANHLYRVLNVQESQYRDRSLIKRLSVTLERYFFESYEKKGYSFTTTERDLVLKFNQLNEEGQQEAIKRIAEMTEISKFIDKE